MFRPLRRKKQQLSEAECLRILKSEPRGVLSVLGDDGYPYGLPHNHWYCEEDGRLYFHSGNTGHKIDALRAHDKVSYCVFGSGERADGDWALQYKSVIVFGRVNIVEDKDKAIEITRKLSYAFTSDTEYIENEIRDFSPGLLVFSLKIESMCGKRVRES